VGPNHQAAEVVSGDVDLNLFKGNIIMRGRSSPLSLYDEDLVSMDVAGDFDPSNSTGFIKTLATRLRASAAREKNME
jgi:argininosuccinate synthase